MRHAAQLPVRAVMQEGTPSCPAHSTVGRVLEELLQFETGHAIITGIDGQPVGIARLSDLIRVDPELPVTRLMTPTVLWIAAHESVAIAVRVMAMSGADFLVVHDEAGGIVGGLGTRNLIGLGMGLDTVELAG